VLNFCGFGVWGKQIFQISKAQKWRSGQSTLRMKKKCLKLILLRRSKFSKSLFSCYDPIGASLKKCWKLILLRRSFLNPCFHVMLLKVFTDQIILV
jgi:hypothetical protein